MPTIGSLAVNITASTSSFQKGIKGVYAAIGGLTSKLSLIGSAVEASVGGLLVWFARAGSEIHDLSQVTGIAVEELDFLKYAAEQSGTGIESLTKAARELITHGIDPNKIEEIMTKLAGIKDPIQQAQSSMYYFSKRTGLSLRPMMKDLTALRKRFEELGGGLNQKMVDDADALGDSWGDLMLAIRNVAFTIADILSPAVVSLTAYIADKGKTVRQWAKDHAVLVMVVAAGITAFVILAPVLLTLSAAINVATKALWALKLVFTVLSLNPIVLEILAVTGLIAGLIYLLVKAHDAWVKFTGGTAGGGPQGNYISRHLAPQNFPAESLTPADAIVAAQRKKIAAQQMPPADTSQGSGDSSEMLARMDRMVGYLGQIAGQPPVQLSAAGVR